MLLNRFNRWQGADLMTYIGDSEARCFEISHCDHYRIVLVELLCLDAAAAWLIVVG